MQSFAACSDMHTPCSEPMCAILLQKSNIHVKFHFCGCYRGQQAPLKTKAITSLHASTKSSRPHTTHETALAHADGCCCCSSTCCCGC